MKDYAPFVYFFIYNSDLPVCWAKVSPFAKRWSSGDVATPVVVPIRLDWHTVYEPTSLAA